MTRVTVALFSVFLLPACNDVTGPRSPADVAPAASVTQSMQRIPVEGVYVFPVPRGCTGEAVEWHLTQEILFRTMTDAQGNFHGNFSMHDQGSWGVGLATGLMYRLAEVQVEHNEVTGGDSEHDSAVFVRRFISQGAMPNFRVTDIFHYTLDAAGNLVSWRNDASRTCD